MKASRREFLNSLAAGSAVLSLGSAVPGFLAEAAAANSANGDDTILVVLQLTGGNDGLNTVIPFDHDVYRKLRPKLAIPADQVLKIKDGLGFHPSARGLADLLELGKLAIVQGVGYPEPNRSHFESMDIWHTCHRKGGPRTTGWLGRYLDAAKQPTQNDASALHLGHEKQPLALASDHVRVPSLSSPENFRLQDGGNQQLRETIRDLAARGGNQADDLAGFLQTSTTSALSASERIAEALRQYDTPVTYPDNALAKKMKTIAQLIEAGLKTRVYYVELDGFDTHSQQGAAHVALLQQFSSSLHAFIQDVNHQGHSERVLVVCFSEFGRRVQENASEGTDHGAAGPMFIAGSRVKPGLATEHPSLTDLEDGDVKFKTDFRQVYGTLLDQWLSWPSPAILGGKYDPVPILKS
jgi:uncharacterized protein (DUF1501 family)